MLINGWPKCGTHALEVMLTKAGFVPAGGGVLQRLPGEPHVFKNTGTGNLFRGHVWDWHGPVVVIVRHPRNAWISMCRHQHQEPSAALVEQLNYNTFNYLDGYLRFVGCWAEAPIVRYEDMDLATARRTDTPTLNDRPSDWREYWNGDIDAAWAVSAGPDLEQQLHY